MNLNIILGLLLQVVLSSLGDSVNDPSFDKYIYQVKHIEDFMSRFNGSTLTVDSTQIENYKANNLIFLFDENTYNENKVLADSLVYCQLYYPKELNYTFNNWEATISCYAEYAGSPTTIELILKTQKIKEYMYKWVITGAKGDVLSLTPNKTNPGLKISPTDNSVNFISLSHITSVEAPNIINYADSSYVVDPLTSFFTLVHEKKLVIKEVQKVQYRFVNIHGFDFVVSQQLLDKAHAGWLITDIYLHEEN